MHGVSVLSRPCYRCLLPPVVYAAHPADTEGVFRGAMSADAEPGGGGRGEGRKSTHHIVFSLKGWAGRFISRSPRTAKSTPTSGFLVLISVTSRRADIRVSCCYFCDGKMHRHPDFLFSWRKSVHTSRFLVLISMTEMSADIPAYRFSVVAILHQSCIRIASEFRQNGVNLNGGAWQA